MLGESSVNHDNKTCIKETTNKCSAILKKSDSFSLNRLTNLGRGFGACPSLEILDVTHNKLSEDGLPGNFWMMGKNTG